MRHCLGSRSERVQGIAGEHGRLEHLSTPVSLLARTTEKPDGSPSLRPKFP